MSEKWVSAVPDKSYFFYLLHRYNTVLGPMRRTISSTFNLLMGRRLKPSGGVITALKTLEKPNKRNKIYTSLLWPIFATNERKSENEKMWLKQPD